MVGCNRNTRHDSKAYLKIPHKNFQQISHFSYFYFLDVKYSFDEEDKNVCSILVRTASLQ